MLALSGCTFPPLPDIGEDGGALDSNNDSDGVDASPDASAPCAPDSIVCDDASGIYVECSASGTVAVEIRCSLGCATGAEKCVEITPGNGLAPYVDMVRDRTDLPSVAFAGTSRIQAGDGVVFNGASTVIVPSYTVDLNRGRVFLFESLSISGTVKVPPATNALVLVADGEVVIDGLLDVSADGATHGPGALLSAEATTCRGVSPAMAAGPTPGGGGGGRYRPGGRGGSDGGGELGATGGSQDPDTDLEPLRAGCEGGQVVEQDFDYSSGGGAGGAVHIISRTRIRIIGSGIIDASGGGAGPSIAGGSGDGISGGGGGGSGGSIFLEAPEVILDGAAVVLSTKGGGGAAPSSVASAKGEDGGYSASPSAGGSASGQPTGGAGGLGATIPGDGGAGTGASGGAGGGGASGITVIRTATGAINPQNGAAIRSGVFVNPLRTRQVP